LERDISELERQLATNASDVDVQMTNAANRLKFAKVCILCYLGRCCFRLADSHCLVCTPQADCEATERKIADADTRIQATRLGLENSKPKVWRCARLWLPMFIS